MPFDREKGNGADGDGFMRADRGSSTNKNRISVNLGASAWIVAVFAVISIVSALLSVIAYQRSDDSEDASFRAVERMNQMDNRMREVIMEKRLLQEDMIMMRAKLKAEGIEVETAGDHE